MRRTWYLLQWRDDRSVLIRQRKVQGTSERTTYGSMLTFDEPATCYNGESLGMEPMTDEEAERTKDIDFVVLTGAEIMEGLGFR